VSSLRTVRLPAETPRVLDALEVALKAGLRGRLLGSNLWLALVALFFLPAILFGPLPDAGVRAFSTGALVEARVTGHRTAMSPISSWPDHVVVAEARHGERTARGELFSREDQSARYPEGATLQALLTPDGQLLFPAELGLHITLDGADG